MRALQAIKQELDAYVGENVIVRATRGRSRLEQAGVLESTYGSIFVVKLQLRDNDTRRVSYAYSDLLTENIELVVCAAEGEVAIKAD